MSVPNSNSLNSSDHKKIAQASLNHLLIIKEANGKIIVREMQYIPDIDYLRSKNFDISHNFFKTLDKAFDGIISISKWNGEKVNKFMLVDGIIKKKLSKTLKVQNNSTDLQQRNSGEEFCVTVTTTEQHRWCYGHYQGDVLVTDYCEDWEDTGIVSVEEFCTWLDNQGGEECEDPTVSLQQCFCDMVGGCEEEEEEAGCKMSLEEAIAEGNDIMNSSEVSYTITNGTPLLTNVNGIEKKEVPSEWNFYTATGGKLIQKVEYCVDYTKKLSRAGANDPWKFESLKFVGQRVKSGSYPMCIEGKMEAREIANNISQDQTSAKSTISYEFGVTIKCAFGVELFHASGTLENTFNTY